MDSLLQLELMVLQNLELIIGLLCVKRWRLSLLSSTVSLSASTCKLILQREEYEATLW